MVFRTWQSSRSRFGSRMPATYQREIASERTRRCILARSGDAAIFREAAGEGAGQRENRFPSESVTPEKEERVKEESAKEGVAAGRLRIYLHLLRTGGSSDDLDEMAYLRMVRLRNVFAVFQENHQVSSKSFTFVTSIIRCEKRRKNFEAEI